MDDQKLLARKYKIHASNILNILDEYDELKRKR